MIVVALIGFVILMVFVIPGVIGFLSDHAVDGAFKAFRGSKEHAERDRLIARFGSFDLTGAGVGLPPIGVAGYPTLGVTGTLPAPAPESAPVPFGGFGSAPGTGAQTHGFPPPPAASTHPPAWTARPIPTTIPTPIRPPAAGTAPRAAGGAPPSAVCTGCGAPRTPGARFCGVCGAPSADRPTVAPGPGVCRRCANALAPDSRFCGKCGAPTDHR